MVKNLPAVQKTACNEETTVQSLGQEDSLEKNSNSLQCSCLENPMHSGAWRALVHGVAELDMT